MLVGAIVVLEVRANAGSPPDEFEQLDAAVGTAKAALVGPAGCWTVAGTAEWHHVGDNARTSGTSGFVAVFEDERWTTYLLTEVAHNTRVGLRKEPRTPVRQFALGIGRDLVFDDRYGIWEYGHADITRPEPGAAAFNPLPEPEWYETQDDTVHWSESYEHLGAVLGTEWSATFRADGSVARIEQRLTNGWKERVTIDLDATGLPTEVTTGEADAWNWTTATVTASAPCDGTRVFPPPPHTGARFDDERPDLTAVQPYVACVDDRSSPGHQCDAP